ncbi:MAG: adenylate/guanylate cyclase domain-containing protein [Thermodesulfobacteriota bacterium]|nr:adenylate/guanylate cyclase domain-containing protein [Thermodesulfobacteriota bacterium]
MKLLKTIFKIDSLRIGFFIISILLVICAASPSFLELMELKLYDLRLLFRGALESGGEVVIVVIDEKSLKELGRWPWSRDKIARLINTLTEYNVKVIGFDIIFAESEENTRFKDFNLFKKEIERLKIENKALADFLDNSIIKADVDGKLAGAVKKSGRVVLGYFFQKSNGDGNGNDDKKYISILPSKYNLVKFADSRAKQFPVMEVSSLKLNIERISKSTQNAGYFNIFPDPDGTVRWAPLAVKYKQDYFPSLALQMLRQYLGNPLLTMKIADYGIASIGLGDISIPVEKHGRLLINYLGKPQTFPHYSFSDVIKKRIPSDKLKNKIVLVGSTAIGIYDSRVTPFSSVFPGVEIHANILNSILHKDFLYRPSWALTVDLLIIIFIGGVLSYLLSKLKATYGLLISVSFLLIIIMGNLFVFSKMGVWINLVYPVLSLILIYLGITAFRYMTEEREKKRVKMTFQQYVAPSVVDEMLKEPERLTLGGERKELTILFSDIRGFTSISEKLDPETLVKLLNQYLSPMTDIIFKHEGTLDKYMGDAIMAIYGAPLALGSHAEKACLTALDMVEELKFLCKNWEEQGLPGFNIGIGINTGIVTVGNMGSEKFFDYTVMGDNVNLGSRLEGLNKEYGTRIIVSENTFSRTRDSGFFFRELDMVRVKGKKEPVKIYELLEKNEKLSDPELLSHFSNGIKAYRNKMWDKAIEEFKKLLETLPDDPPSLIYSERCRLLQENPPPEDWDGVYIMKTK